MIPGDNLLAMALSIMGTQDVQYYAFASRSVNTIGYEVNTYDEPVTITGSLQALPLNEYEKFGFDMAREYVTFFANLQMKESGRDRSSDYFTANGFRYSIVLVTDWSAIDGWSEVKAIKDGAA